MKTPKVIPDTVYDTMIDVRRYLPMIETREFQALRYRMQLGMVYLIFPAAMHTRFAHSVGSYHMTKLLTDRWLASGTINEEQRDALLAFALYHDIGHGPFSHVTEDFYEASNSELSLMVIKRLKTRIEACGVNYELVENYASHKDPLAATVYDKNLGTEKIDYLVRDGFYTTLSRPPGVNYLLDYIYFVNGTLAIDEKIVDHVVDVQNFFMGMYKKVYFRKASIIAQRMFQKMVYYLPDSGVVSKAELNELTDYELLGLMSISGGEIVRSLYKLLRKRELFQEAIVIRPKRTVLETRVAGKAIAVFGIEDEEAKKLVESPALHKKNQTGLENLEDAVAELAGIPRGTVLVVPVFNPERFKAEDVMIYDGDGKFHSLRLRRPEHFLAMEATARMHTALRICTLPKYRATLASPIIARKVHDLIMSAST